MSRSLQEFLECLKNTHFEELFTHCTPRVVCGNSSADFDSVASAITYAYCSYQRDPEHPIIPIISIPRSDLSLRKDIVRALRDMSVTEDILFFIEDLKHLKNGCGSLNAILVDHNQLEMGIKPYIDEVTGIIDHHKDEHLYPLAIPRQIRTTGSCSSLVFNYWSEQLRDVSLLKEVARLSIGAGLIDTSNFHFKVEQPDIEASYLYSKLLPDIDRVKYYERLRHDKDDLKGLTIREILRKDYKQYSFETSSKDELKIGIASVVKPLKWFYDTFGGQASFEEACLSAEKDYDMDVFLVMTSCMEHGAFKRELVIKSTTISNKDLSEIIQYLKDKINLQPINEMASTSSLPLFRQLDISASRKQVAPLLKDAIKLIK